MSFGRLMFRQTKTFFGGSGRGSKFIKRILKKQTCYILGLPPHPLTVTTRIITFLVGNPYKPSFVTVAGWGVDRSYIYTGRTKVMLLDPCTANPFPLESFCQHDSGQFPPRKSFLVY